MTVVRFDRVSKRFMLHHERPRSFQELFLNTLHLKRTSREEYWALRDVSFEVRRREMVGIIGANGAGKSTVLKLLSRIIEPSAGTITVGGRVGALLELGAGFHPDLTGRENIYLNGSILGLSRAEIRRRLDDIIGFAELERFIDVPVKHYSSGMYVRLGFSVAVHTDPEILLVDEVLAVGDQAFQRRCLDKIGQMKRQGVTILFVTHALDQVRALCDRAIWLEEGRVQADGPVEQVLEQYLAHTLADEEQDLLRIETAQRESKHWLHPARLPDECPAEVGNGAFRRWGSLEAEIVRVQLLDDQGRERRIFHTGRPFVVRIHFLARERIERPQFGLALYHVSGFQINGPNTLFSGLEIAAIEGEGYLDYIVESLPLLEGSYLLSASLNDYEGSHPYDYHHQAYTFHVQPGGGVREKYGSVLIPAVWQPGPTGFVPPPPTAAGGV